MGCPKTPQETRRETLTAPIPSGFRVKHGMTEENPRPLTCSRLPRQLFSFTSFSRLPLLSPFCKIFNSGKGVVMKFNVTIGRDEDGIWVVECPSIPGCVSQGKTRGEALENVKEAIALCLEVRAEKGLSPTVETEQVEVAI